MFVDSKRSINVNYNEKLAKYGIQSATRFLSGPVVEFIA